MVTHPPVQREQVKTPPASADRGAPAPARWSLVYRFPGETVVTATLLWTTEARWKQGRECGEPGWATVVKGGVVLALKLDLSR